MGGRTDEIEVKLPRKLAGEVVQIAKLAGVKPETVIRVAIAQAVHAESAMTRKATGTQP